MPFCCSVTLTVFTDPLTETIFFTFFKIANKHSAGLCCHPRCLDQRSESNTINTRKETTGGFQYKLTGKCQVSRYRQFSPETKCSCAELHLLRRKNKYPQNVLAIITSFKGRKKKSAEFSLLKPRQ